MGIEWVLNSATNRWGLNKRSKVGPVTEWIRECQPQSFEEWRDFYFRKLEEFLRDKGVELSPKEYLEELGRRLHSKVTEVLAKEIQDVDLDACQAYIKQLVLERTYDGFVSEKQTIYGQLERELGVPIEPASEKLDRRYDVDFIIELPKGKIGIQIKPVTYAQSQDAKRWTHWMAENHEQFRKRFGGRVHVVISVKDGQRKIIANSEVIDQIRADIERLR